MILTLDAIERSGLPNLIQIAPTNAQPPGYDYIHEIVKRHADKMDVPVSLYFDHGKTQEDAKQAMRMDFTSVMIGDVAFSFEENIAFTQEAVDFCKSYDVPVEVELGAILDKEDDHVSEVGCKAESEKVETFVEHTGCDMLVIFINNVHGLDDIPRIDIPLLKRVAEVSPVPLIIHDGSGVTLGILRNFVDYRTARVNIASDLRRVFITAVSKVYMNNHNEANLVQMMASAKNAIEEDMYSKIPMMNGRHRLGK